MDDLIYRQAAIDVLAAMQGQCTSKVALIQNSKIWQQIKDLPSAQPEIIRCKECKYWERDVIFKDGWCRGKRQGDPNWFCADGERRE